MPRREPKFEMSLSLSLVKDLGENLYSNVPAVLSEVVANSWDADAEWVDIVIDNENGVIEVTDNGIGMTEDDINKKYLHVGYRRREEENPITKKERHVMGRKGIGKLSLFSIAGVVEIHTVKNGQKSGFVMKYSDILETIKKREAVYNPEEVNPTEINIKEGTKLFLTELKKRVTKRTPDFLRKRIARRFLMIGPKYGFVVRVNGTPISVEDKDYLKNILFLWLIGDVDKALVDYCERNGKLEKKTELSGIVDSEKGYEISGWIGTVQHHGQLRGDLNKIPLFGWNKIVQEDILETFGEGGIYSKYLLGEISADFLDLDEEADIVTSNRQKVIEDDPRYEALLDLVLSILKEVKRVWTDWRNVYAEKEALKNPVLEEWQKTLKARHKPYAQRLFGLIGSLPIDDDKEDDRKQLYKYGILAFERLRLKEDLGLLEHLETLEDGKILEILVDFDDLEATLYHDIVKNRLNVLEAFKNITPTQKEKVIQEYIYDHLWLLNPSWERATEDRQIEATVTAVFDRISNRLSEEERRGRFDIRYRSTAGKHIIIELKKADVRINVYDLAKQVKKYKDALEHCIENNFPAEPRIVEVICLLGSRPTGASEEEINRVLGSINGRYITYDTLIKDAEKSYKDYLDSKEALSRLAKIIEQL